MCVGLKKGVYIRMEVFELCMYVGYNIFSEYVTKSVTIRLRIATINLKYSSLLISFCISFFVLSTKSIKE